MEEKNEPNETGPQGIKKAKTDRKARPAKEIYPPRRMKNRKLSSEQMQRYKLSEEWAKNQDYYFDHQEEIDQMYDGKYIEVSDNQASFSDDFNGLGHCNI
jgi:hypothetical protein